MYYIALSLVVLISLVLGGGGLYVLQRGGARQGLLMLALALVLVANVAFWAVLSPY